MTAASKDVRLSGPVVSLSRFHGDKLEFKSEPLWELAEAVAERMAVNAAWRDASELRRVSADPDHLQQAILQAAAGVVDELMYELKRYAETGEENDSVRYMLDCLRLIQQREAVKRPSEAVSVGP